MDKETMDKKAQKIVERGMYFSDRCQLCHDFGEKVEPYLCPRCVAKMEELGYRKLPKDKPLIVCLCGSTRFGEAFQKAELEATLGGKIVLTIGCNMRSDTEIFGHLPEVKLNEIKVKLDELHLRKIDLADEVMILNVGGYIGESTREELEYAQRQGKKITYLESQRGSTDNAS